MEENLKTLKEIVKVSLRRVERPYFKLETTYEPSGVVRERVFCYELYHQMRREISKVDGFPLSLNGEIDKRGHIDFAEEDRKNPDFVLHIPGEHEGNTVVIEVKGKLSGRSTDIVKDFKTLNIFAQKYKYRLGLFVLYNHTIWELKKEVGLIVDIPPESLGKIHILCIKEAGDKVEDISLAKFSQLARY